MKTHEIVECPKCKGTGKILDAVNALLRKYIRSEVKNYCKTVYKTQVQQQFDFNKET
jgi:predicted methyltransferase